MTHARTAVAIPTVPPGAALTAPMFTVFMVFVSTSIPPANGRYADPNAVSTTPFTQTQHFLLSPSSTTPKSCSVPSNGVELDDQPQPAVAPNRTGCTLPSARTRICHPWRDVLEPSPIMAVSLAFGVHLPSIQTISFSPAE